MPHLPKSLHLEYNLTKPLRASYSILGILTLTCAMIGVIIGTLLTKGLVAAQDVEYLTNPQEPGYSCNSTLIYPGQLFGSFALNTSFQYQAVSQFAYRGQSLTNCTVANLTYIDVIGPPLNYPSITVNQSVSCMLENPHKDGSVTVQLAVSKLQYWGYINRHTSVEVGTLSVNLLGQLATYQAPWNRCNSSQPIGFRIDGGQWSLAVFPSNSPGNGICSFSVDFAPEAGTLITVTQEMILDDWTTKLATLPHLLYPCVQQKKIWGPFWTVLLDVLTTMLAFFSPLLAVLLLVLQYFQERGEKRTSAGERAPLPLRPLHSPSVSRDEGLGLLSSLPPDNTSAMGHLEESRLLVQRLENIVEAFQARIHQMENLDAASTPGTPGPIASRSTLSAPQLQEIPTILLQTSEL